jgi:phospholipid-binding lipoprotein MlaA
LIFRQLKVSAPTWPLLLLALLSGCAGTQTNEDSGFNSTYDPLEPLNRKVYALNDAFDRVLLKPTATGYKAVTPGIVRRGITNFFDNLATPRSALNNFLQGKPARGFNEIGRFVFNTTLGLGGLIDIAGLGGMQAYEEDFGQTFAVWGLPEGPYLVLPLLGSRSLLETVAFPLDYYAGLERYIKDREARGAILALRIIDIRHRLLAADQFLEESTDPYITFREAYRQNREYEIFDGDPPVEDQYYEFFDEEDF